MGALAVALTELDGVLARLQHVKRQGKGFSARCPAHDDQLPSLSISEGRDGRIVLHCHAGCSREAVVQALGLTMPDLFPPSPYAPAPIVTPKPTTDRPALTDTYDYTDANGALVFQVCRFTPKTFRQRRPDGNGNWVYEIGDIERPLYRLPQVIEAAAQGKRVWIVEGEKDADRLAKEYPGGGVATTSPGGAGKWRESMSRALAKASDVVILPDNDDTGRSHAEQVAASLTALGATVRVVQLPGVPLKGDVSDWLDAGGDFDELETLIQSTRIWTPDPAKRVRWRLDEILGNDALMRPPAPIVPRLVWRGRSTLLAAQEKSGKSTLIGFLAAQVSRGGQFLGDPCQAGDVLIVALEESLGDVARRLRHFGADPARVHIVDRLPPDPRERPEALAEHIRAVSPTLVLVDTLMAYGSGIVEDENAVAQMQPLVQGLTDVAHRMDVGLCAAHHNKKTGGYRGSSAIGGAVDVIAEMSVPDEEKDPTLRKLRVLGRLPVHGFDMRYDGSLYLDASGIGLPLIQRVLDFVRRNSPTSTNAVRLAIGGRFELVQAALQTLERKRFITDEGDPLTRARQWVASAAAPPLVNFEAENARY